MATSSNHFYSAAHAGYKCLESTAARRLAYVNLRDMATHKLTRLRSRLCDISRFILLRLRHSNTTALLRREFESLHMPRCHTAVSCLLCHHKGTTLGELKGVPADYDRL